MTVRQIAALYSAYRCGALCPLALMGSADPRLIPPVGFSPGNRCRLGGSRSDLFAITSCRALRNLSAATSCVGLCFRRRPRLCRLADEVRLVRPVMGQQGPDRASRLVGQRDRDHVGRSSLGEAQRPLWWRLASGEHGAGTMDQQSAEIRVPRFEIPSMRTRPPVPSCRGTRPSQAANSRPDLNAAGSPIAATTAVAVSTPTPGISAIRRLSALPLYGRLPGHKDRFRCDGQADCSSVFGLSMRGVVPAGPDGICRSAPHSSGGLFAREPMQAWRIAV